VRYLIATDTGGTFTDVAVYDREAQKVTYGKTLTNYADLIDGVLDGLSTTDAKLDDALLFKHGTTHVINTFIQRSGARTALVATRGFADMIEIGRGNRPVPFALEYMRDAPLIERPDRFEVDERIDAAGKVLRPLDREEIRRLARRLRETEFGGIAVSFINAYANPSHEEQAVAILREELPGVYVTSGTILTREWFEYERSSTAAANAYVGSRMAAYADTFGRRLSDAGFRGTFYMMGSNGGVLSQSRAVEQPVALVESGPIGGCIGAAAYARALGLPRVIAFDMGGTTAKCALVQDGKFEVQPAYYVGGYDRGFPLKTPVLDIVEVGAGGGSIARVDNGRLMVGPQSAGSEPGPVAFGKGGTEPTVTDANLVLGRISGGSFLQGRLKLDRDAAVAAVRDRVAAPLGYDGNDGVDLAAQGILDLAAATMSAAIKEITIERGHDVREFTLFPFGGGGPLFASVLARQLGIPRIVVPPHPGNFSTLGMLTAGARIDLSRMIVAEAAGDVLAKIGAAFSELESEARETMGRDLAGSEIRFERALEMRYRGQKHTVRIPFDAGSSLDAIREAFQTEYRSRYGHANPDNPIEVLEARLGTEADVPAPDLLRLADADGAAASASYREVYFPAPHGRVTVPVWRRDTLRPGAQVEGPAVIEEFSSTTVLMPGDRAVIGRFGEIAVDCAVAVSRSDAGKERPEEDPITLEIIRHELVSIPNQIDKNITRTAFSALINEYKDYAVGIVDAEGRLISQSRGSLAIFVANALGTAVRDGLALFGADGLRHGDVVISNHAGTLGQHLNNVVMYTPIRLDDGKGEIAAFFCVLMHWLDVGGSMVGSCVSTTTTEIFQEGIQFRSVKLIEEGRRRPDMFRMIEYNTRFPEMLLGDVEAQIAGCLMGRGMVMDVIGKYGPAAYRSAVEMLWSQAEAKVRAAVAAAPDGEYSAFSFLDDDGLNLGKTVPVGVKVRIAGEDITVDFSGVSDQLAGPLNAGRNGGAIAAARIAIKYLFSPDGPVNEGDFRPLKVEIPDGKFLSAAPTAPIGGSGSMIPTVVDTILRALAPAFPERAAAAHHGTYGVHSFYGVSPVTRAPFFHLDTCVGGWGATAAQDGFGPSRSNVHGDTSDVPVEMQEAFNPYRFESYAIRTDSGGAGRNRGGLGVVKTYRITSPCNVNLKFDRTKCPPWGLAGGEEGLPGGVEIRGSGGETRKVLKGDHPLGPGDLMIVTTGGGGGYGTPRQRPVELVRDDVRHGYVSAAAAAERYGVVVRNDGAVDRTATEMQRRSMGGTEWRQP
jgi:N-methylhydantoinase A/oxoprolinase/acetone carboxylase beta subunit/N-methylhydantoinase B/oxoprolinase/acetone carboxylase alpha subunit